MVGQRSDFKGVSLTSGCADVYSHAQTLQDSMTIIGLSRAKLSLGKPLLSLVFPCAAVLQSMLLWMPVVCQTDTY